MTYPEAIEYLYSLARFGMKLGLENTLGLTALCGNPEHRLKFVHVAGTNGKGSTCAVLESVYRAAGYRTGLFTSPHLVSFRERIQVNRVLIPEEDVVRLINLIRKRIKANDPDESAGLKPTFFEFVTVMALLWFAEQNCDLVIWETGMGGRLDSTNIVVPLASVITPIALDHQQWLGTSLEEIAAEKAGIIKPAVPVVTGPQTPEVARVLDQTARRCGSGLVHAGDSLSSEYESLLCSRLPGQHQRQNAAIALATIEMLAGQFPVSESAKRFGLQSVEWPGRLQRIQKDKQTVLLDCAHNDAGFAALLKALPALNLTRPSAFIVGLAADKDVASILRRLSGCDDEFHFVPLPMERSTPPETLAGILKDFAPDSCVRIHGSTAEALKATCMLRSIIVTGSFFLAGEAMEELQLIPAGAASERGLNNWRR